MQTTKVSSPFRMIHIACFVAFCLVKTQMNDLKVPILHFVKIQRVVLSLDNDASKYIITELLTIRPYTDLTGLDLSDICSCLQERHSPRRSQSWASS